MKTIINRLTQHETLSRKEAKNILVNISLLDYPSEQIAAFLTVFMMRGITIKELEGFRDALLELCLKVDFEGYELTDFCGTGGDGKDTFNISTLSAFVAAGAGLHVAKHSNYGVSSGCGSSNVLEALGIRFTNDADFLHRSMDKAGIVFIHAPLFHPAMKSVAPVRKAMGVKTFFNILGPLSNPIFTQNQITGVFNLELARIYGYIFQETTKNYAIIHALDGYDEISLTGDVKIITREDETILSPQEFGLLPLSADNISGGNNVEISTDIFMKIIRGDGTDSQNDVVSANAGLGISIAKNISLPEGISAARESLQSGKAYTVLSTLKNLCKSLK